MMRRPVPYVLGGLHVSAGEKRGARDVVCAMRTEDVQSWSTEKNSTLSACAGALRLRLLDYGPQPATLSCKQPPLGVSILALL